MARLNLVSPWAEYYHKLQAFFKKDPSITVIFDEEEEEVKIYVDSDQEKYEALITLLPKTKEFGNVTLKITVIPSNGSINGRMSHRYLRAGSDTEALLIQALRGNRAFAFSQTVNGVMTNPIVYIVFANEVVQYYNDDLGDYYGQCSTLYQTLAEDIFNHLPEVHYCTDKPPRFIEDEENVNHNICNCTSYR